MHFLADSACYKFFDLLCIGEEKGGNLAELSLSLTAAVQEWLEKRFAKFGGETWSSRPLSIYEASRKFSAFQWFQKSKSEFV